MFIEKHKFADGRVERFHSSYDQAQAWQRLELGNYFDADIIFLHHELLELEYMRSGEIYEIAHNKANVIYNWQKLIEKK